MHEDVAGLQAQEGRFGDPAVGAAEPEDGGVLAFGAGGEEVWVRVRGGLGPVLVAGEVLGEVLAVVCVWEGKGCGLASLLSFFLGCFFVFSTFCAFWAVFAGWRGGVRGG